MLLPGRPLFDPAPDDVDLLVRQLVMAQVCRRHSQNFVVGGNALQQDALGGVLAVDRNSAALQLDERPFFVVESKFRLAIRLVGPMASEAPVRQNRANVAVKLGLVAAAGRPGDCPSKNQKQERQSRPFEWADSLHENRLLALIIVGR